MSKKVVLISVGVVLLIVGISAGVYFGFYYET